MQALVYTLLDVFDASRDLHETLKAKEKRDYEQSLRSRGYPSGRKFDYVDEVASGDGSLVLDKAAVTRQFEIGFQEVGAQFAIGDGMFFSLFSSACRLFEKECQTADHYSDHTNLASVTDHHTAIGHHNYLPVWTHIARAHIAPSV